MAGSNSKKAIIGAIVANTLIAISKFIASFFTGSSAMLSEGIHSLVDTANGFLLLLGIKRSKKEPDEKHPFGYGQEVYFWSFLVAILIFGLGGGFALYEGIHHTLHPSEPGNPIWNYVVLTLAMAFEGVALHLALKAFKTSRGNLGFVEAIRKSKDSATFAVIIEDSAALLGLMFAMIGVTLAQLTGNGIWDGISSIAIGLLLFTVSAFLAKEAKGLLVGEGMRPEELVALENLLNNHAKINRFETPKSLHFGPEEILLALDIDFQDGLTTDELEQEIYLIEKEIAALNPKITKIYIETKAIHDHV